MCACNHQLQPHDPIPDVCPPAMTHVAFRSAETGRYLWHAQWPTEDVRKFEAAAALRGLTLDEFLHRAIGEYLGEYLDSLEDDPRVQHEDVGDDDQ